MLRGVIPRMFSALKCTTSRDGARGALCAPLLLTLSLQTCAAADGGWADYLVRDRTGGRAAPGALRGSIYDALHSQGSDERIDDDYREVVRRNKSNVEVGVGANYIRSAKIYKKGEYSINPSFLIGYAYFFNANLGGRVYASLDNSDRRAYYAGNIDVVYDVHQGRNVGFGVIIGASVGYMRVYAARSGSHMIYGNAGASIGFDGGKNRLEILVRYPARKPKIGGEILDPHVTLIAMYSYTF